MKAPQERLSRVYLAVSLRYHQTGRPVNCTSVGFVNLPPLLLGVNDGPVGQRSGNTMRVVRQLRRRETEGLQVEIQPAAI